MGVRQDVAKLGTGWNRTLLNYALAMRELDSLDIRDRNSWKFLAAMHGIDPVLWLEERLIDTESDLPGELSDDPTYGNQCQHGSWFFLPWHRGYLFTFEAIVAATVRRLTGDDWALPYWNYFDTSEGARRIPDAFVAETMPDGSPNPLRKYPRRPGITQLPASTPFPFGLSAMDENDFLVGNDGSIGFGGGVSGDFVQFARWSGDLEMNPHNMVHGMVGGYMGNALLAGLDPLFWLHHCNIDRLWEAWMRAPGKTMVRDQRWLDGPADRTFIMPALGAADPGVTFNGRDTLRGGKFHRDYDDLSAGTGVIPGADTVARVGMGSPEQQRVEPIGANASTVRIGAAAVLADVALDALAATSGVAAMGAMQPGKKVTRLYVALEGVRGAAPSPVLEVYVNLPPAVDPGLHTDRLAGSLTLFGLNVASRLNGPHGGNGLGYTLDITDLAQRLLVAGEFDPTRVRVTLVPREQISEDAPVTVERISILQRSGVVS